MDSPAAAVHKRYQRFFAWTFALATVLAAVLIWIEMAFPPQPFVYPAPPAAAGGTAAGVPFDSHDFQLLVTVAAMIAALVSLIGLVVSAPLAWRDARRVRSDAAVELALKRQDHINWLAAERAGAWPGNVVSMPRTRARVSSRLPRRVHGGAHMG
ncbi:hypothetical protein [Variovorax sp. KK3]|uniref:hypothetical protein n=1 Tax=Variovorax sp. KK3 TaxID=1855728 RepID=UPI00097BA809|nr:hypothetical protein [Variovorax sp. KK3]